MITCVTYEPWHAMTSFTITGSSLIQFITKTCLHYYLTRKGITWEFLTIYRFNLTQNHSLNDIQNVLCMTHFLRFCVCQHYDLQCFRFTYRVFLISVINLTFILPLPVHPRQGRGGGGGGIKKRSGTEKRCSHNLQSVHLGQRGIFERALFVIQVFSNVKTVCLLAFYCWCYYHKVKLRKRS